MTCISRSLPTLRTNSLKFKLVRIYHKGRVFQDRHLEPIISSLTNPLLPFHRKCVHLGIKEHKCAECGREFARKDKLNRHILIHSPNRPTFPCPFKTFTGCQKTFYRKDKLQRHIFAHSKEKPYKCETCQKVFARKV